MREISKNQFDEHRYDDILNVQRPVSKNHRHMLVSNRAAQFMPYDALSGYRESIQENGRITLQKVELSDDEKSKINDVLNQILVQIKNHPKVRMTYFLMDDYKDGGSYEQIEGCVKKIELGKVIFMDRFSVEIEDIISMEFV